MGFSQTLIIYSLKVKKKKKAQQRLVLMVTHHHQIKRTAPSLLEEVGDVVIAEVKANHCSPDAPSSSGSQRGLF